MPGLFQLERFLALKSCRLTLTAKLASCITLRPIHRDIYVHRKAFVENIVRTGGEASEFPIVLLHDKDVSVLLHFFVGVKRTRGTYTDTSAELRAMKYMIFAK